MRLNYFVFIGYLKLGTGSGVQANPPKSLWIRQWQKKKHTHKKQNTKKTDITEERAATAAILLF